MGVYCSLTLKLSVSSSIIIIFLLIISVISPKNLPQPFYMKSTQHVWRHGIVSEGVKDDKEVKSTTRKDVCWENICFGAWNDASFTLRSRIRHYNRKKSREDEDERSQTRVEGKNNQSIIDYKRCSVDEPWLVFKWVL